MNVDMLSRIHAVVASLHFKACAAIRAACVGKRDLVVGRLHAALSVVQAGFVGFLQDVAEVRPAGSVHLRYDAVLDPTR
jgi:hypothetical protein